MVFVGIKKVDKMTKSEKESFRSGSGGCALRHRNHGNLAVRGSFSTVDLLVRTSLDQLLYIFKILFKLFTKRATLMRRSTVHSLPPELVFPAETYKII